MTPLLKSFQPECLFTILGLTIIKLFGLNEVFLVVGLLKLLSLLTVVACIWISLNPLEWDPHCVVVVVLSKMRRQAPTHPWVSSIWNKYLRWDGYSEMPVFWCSVRNECGRSPMDSPKEPWHWRWVPKCDVNMHGSARGSASLLLLPIPLCAYRRLVEKEVLKAKLVS